MTREVPVRMPKMSMTMTEGEVSTWAVRPGDVVGLGDVVCEVLTDKVDMEVESPASGTLTRIVVESGIVPVGEPIAWIATDDEEGLGDLMSELAPASTPAAEPEPEPKPAPEPRPEVAPDSVPVDDDVEDDTGAADVGAQPARAAAAAAPAPTTPNPSGDPEKQGPPIAGSSFSGSPDGGAVAAVPRARALAAELGVDLGQIRASRADGVINVADVEGARGRTAASKPLPAATRAPSAPPATPRPAPTGRAAAVRAIVARRMTESAAVPQFTVWRDLVLTRANEVRDGVSWTTVLLQAYAAALRAVPALTSRWDGDAPSSTAVPAIALAVATPVGLLAATFAEPDLADPHNLDAELRAVIGLARTGKVDQAHLVPANATLSNLGGMGVDRFQALVTPPQASVLALGAVSLRPAAIPGGLGLVLMVSAGLTVDHRVADGADAGELLGALAARLG